MACLALGKIRFLDKFTQNVKSMKKLLLFTLLCLSVGLYAQKKVLFDATKAETASNADWIIDADNWDLGYSSGQAYIGGDEARAQRTPTPDQSQITSTTAETFWTGALSAWAVDLVKAGYFVETLPYDGRITYGDNTNDQDLSNYDMFVVCEPNFPFSDAEKTAILNFVYNGGALFMIADHSNSDRDGDGWDSPEIWNDLLKNNSIQSNPFGILFDYKDIDEDTYKIVADDPVTDGQYGQVTNVEFYAGTSMTLYPDVNASVKGLVYQGIVAEPSGNTYVMVATAHYGRGVVFAMGDSSPVDDGTGDNGDRLYDGWLEDANGNHRVMLMNASVWALERTISSVEQTVDPGFVVSVNGRRISVLTTGRETGAKRLEVYSLTGSKLLDRDFSAEASFMVPGNGVYVIRVNDNVRKVVVAGN